MNEFVLRTPLLHYRDIGASSTSKLFLKPENIQPFGSYKIRGVSSAVKAAPRELVQRGLSAASAGNMAQAVAFLAQELGVPCRIYVPDSAPEVKKQAIRQLSAELTELPFQSIWEMVRQPPVDADGLFIHPVFTPGLLEGYGRIAEELVADRPTLDAVVVPFGVGGLTIGISRALKAIKPSVRVYACEPETAAPLHASMKAGKPVKIERLPSFVDAIGTPEVLPKIFEEVQPLVTESIVVRLDEISAALGALAQNSKLICEGAAAASFAAGLKLTREAPGLEVACILTGGNVPIQILKYNLDLL